MADIADPILKMITSQRNLSALSSATNPTEAQVLGWVDRCFWDLVNHFLPRCKEDGILTPGRLDLLNNILNVDVQTGTAGQANLPIAYSYLSIMVGYYSGGTTTYYPSREVDLKTIIDAGISAKYTPATSEPIYAVGNGILYYLPTTNNKVYYHLVQLQESFSSSSTWPINKGLIPLVIYYTLGEMWGQLGNIRRSTIYKKLYLSLVELLTGESSKILENWSR